MKCYERIQGLCQKEGISIRTLQKELQLERNSIKGLSSYPGKINILIKVAARFNVTIDYLCGVVDEPYSSNLLSNINKCSESKLQLLELIAEKDLSHEQIIALSVLLNSLFTFEGE